MATTTDLRQLALERSPTKAGTTRRRRDLVPRYVIPLAVLLGFGSVIGWSARERLLPSQSVTVVPVILTRAAVQRSGTPLFQAAGWVEPRPSPVKVPPLADGVIEDLLVVAGQEVEAGQPVATLVDVDARIALNEAEAALQLREAELDAARAMVVAARAHVDQPVHLEAALAEAEALLAKAQTELVNLPFAIRAAESRLQYARHDLAGKRSAGEALAGRTLQRAQGESDSATAALEELRARRPSLESQAAALRKQSEALRTRLELRIEETRRLAEAEAGVRSAEAQARQAELAVQAARLRLERMTLRAPISGRVLALNTQPGQRVSGLASASEHDSGGVLVLYDPHMLQVRADVRLEDVPHVEPGQPVQIESAALSQPLVGEVLTARSLADVQKNTLQVTVAVHRPPPVIKPDMLVQATFLAPERPADPSERQDDPLRLLVPRPLVETVEGQTTVWLADRLHGIARRKAVVLGQAGNDQLVEVVEGLNPTDKLVAGGREGLRHGDRITIRGEDSTLGTADRTPAMPPATAGPQ